MTDRDLLIYTIAFCALVFSCFQRRELVTTLVISCTFVVNQLTFESDPTWLSLETRYFILFVVYLGSALVLFSRHQTTAFIIALIFVACSLYHQVMVIEIQNKILTLKHSRSDFMTLMIALQLATLIFGLLIGGWGEWR